MPNTLQKCGVA